MGSEIQNENEADEIIAIFVLCIFCKAVPGKEIYLGNLTSRLALPHQIIYDE